MRDPKHIGKKPRPWSVPRLQGTIGNRAVYRMLNPPAPELGGAGEEGPPEPEVAEATRSAPSAWPWAILAAAAGGGLGYALELTRVATYVGPALGVALGFVLFFRLREGQR